MTNDTFEPPVAIAIYKTYMSFAPHLYRFPKLYRYSLGGAIENNILVLLELIFEANALPRPLREASLIKANAKCEILKMLIRMSFELKILENTQYFQLSSELREIGKMLGGWIKFVRSGPYVRSE
ncbi:MAG: four helix bundle protein [Candidatus Liptonbacteria bacterium]|nr:four helix bundle protein [Candidatus Liptonbacteria bacterium]